MDDEDDLEKLNVLDFKNSDHRGTRHYETAERRSAKREAKIVWVLRTAVYLTIIIAAIATTSAVYSNTKTSQFEDHFREYASRLAQGYLYGGCELKGILPADPNIGVILGVIVEVKNDQAISFEVGGPNATFLGLGDQHDKQYDHLAVSAEEFLGSAALRASNCSSLANLTLYPTQDMEDSHSSSTAAMNTAKTAAMFIFILLVFLFYDCVVGYRQRKLLRRAITTSAFVSSLYPKQVRDRLLYEKDESESSSHSATRRRSSLGKSEKLTRVRRSIQGKDDQQSVCERTRDESPSDGSRESSGSDEPRTSSNIIADLYPETTIMFADLAGFTKWSSSKEPKEVFMLLETLYQAFDKIAARHKVFKVETIGDCYVAATGLPDPQPDHAAIMVRFAISCQKCMELLTKTLSNTLGEEVEQLAFRVGMHSGPITGGVLRGQKARFQLFGTTINTASRMESNGVPNEIHVSQSTANELTKLGHEDWLTERQDKVTAKGLGEMQTYFVKYQGNKNQGEDSKNTHSVALNDPPTMFDGIFDLLNICYK